MKKKWIVIILPILAIVITMGLLLTILIGKSVNHISVDSATATGTNVVDASGNVTVQSETDGEDIIQQQSAPGVISTGNLTEFGRGYEGIPATGDYNYGEALQKSILFYELQRSGDLPEETRCNWRGDSAMTDGSDVGLDLTGGWYDAGDHVKFNLPMAYSATMLGWSVYEDYDAYVESGQLDYILGDIRWVNDYLMKCHPEDDIFYYQVGNGSIDHSWWGPAEAMQMERPSYCVTKENPGSAVTGEAAASLAVCSIVFQDYDAEYSTQCLEHAKSLFAFAEETKSDAGYTQAAGFYDSWSGFYDELAWSAAWLYLATGEDEYLEKAKEYYPLAGQDYDWSLCWDDVHIGAALLLAQITQEDSYKDIVEQHLDYWTIGTADGTKITYTPGGLAWLDSWGALRYATTTAYVAAVYSEWAGCPADKATIYWDFAESQANYALGDTGFSYLVGFGENYPEHPHHRTAQGSFCNNMNEPAEARHTLYGALVGGPDASDNYTDEVSNYTTNEVACDYNAGFTGLLAKMYSRYHGETLIDFGAVEEVTVPEIYVEAGVNVEGNDFVEIKAYVINASAWPARTLNQLELRYYVDLSEVYEAGGSVDNIEVTTNYMQAGNSNGLVAWDEANHIYFLSINFSDTVICPGGQDSYRKEIQVRLRNTNGVWDSSNDPSYSGLSTTVGYTENMTLYERGILVFGVEPTEGNHTTTISSNTTTTQGTNEQNITTQSSTQNVQSSESDSIKVSVNYDGMSSSSSSITGTIKITNVGDCAIPLNSLNIEYYFTKDSETSLTFACYHAAVNSSGGGYQGISSYTATFESADGNNTDCICVMTCSDVNNLESGDELTVNFCISHSDWSTMNTQNDYSLEAADHIVITSGQEMLFGIRP